MEHVITVFRSTWMITKKNGVATDPFCAGDRSPGTRVLKLGIEIPSLRQNDWPTKLI